MEMNEFFEFLEKMLSKLVVPEKAIEERIRLNIEMAVEYFSNIKTCIMQKNIDPLDAGAILATTEAAKDKENALLALVYFFHACLAAAIKSETGQVITDQEKYLADLWERVKNG